MSGTTLTHRFPVTATRLFAALVDPDTYPRWLVGAKNIRAVSSDWPSPGSYFEHTVGFGPLVIRDRTTVRDIESPRILTLFVRARPLVEAIVRFEVTVYGQDCTLRMTETPARIYRAITPLARPLIRARNERSLQRLGQLLEQSEQQSRRSASTRGRSVEAG